MLRIHRPVEKLSNLPAGIIESKELWSFLVDRHTDPVDTACLASITLLKPQSSEIPPAVEGLMDQLTTRLKL